MKRQLTYLMALMVVTTLVPIMAYAEDAEPIATTLAKVTTPELSAKYNKKVVTFDAAYNSSLAEKIDLPTKYHKGYVRAVVTDGPTSFMNLLIPTEISEPIFDIPAGEKITWVCEALAGTVPMSFGTKTMYLIVKSFKKAEAPAAQPPATPVTPATP
ncbi:MAG TPA: hypothetical protein PKG98_12135 [Myxococcota bacterium]|nr:hypothetical protein [Myxococcota bacterium]